METKVSAYKSDVLYGTSGDFQADILQTEFLGRDIRGDRRFDIVIVDEVDSMLFDNRSHSVRLSGQAPAMTQLELPLVVIWDHMHRIARHLTTIDGKTFFITEDFERKGKEITLYSDQDLESCAVPVTDVRSFITEQTKIHLEQLLRKLNIEEKAEYEAYKALHYQIISLENEMSKTTDAQEKQDKEAKCESLKAKLKTLSWNKRYPVLDIPIHLQEFARSQIPYWIENALNAAYGYKEGAHYMVQDNRIVPVHYNGTGVFLSNMVWSDGLTQFLQLKEGLPLDPEGISTNFISNVGFFRRFGTSIYGLTGTLGDKSTKDFLHQMYQTDMIVIPPHQRRAIIDNSNSTYICKELAPIVLSDKETWFQTVSSHAISHAKHNRAVLAICKFIAHVRYLASKLRKEYDDEKIFIYTVEGSKFEKSELLCGEIIVATNIAGRGTDLQTCPEVEDNGGLYVMVTFLPESYRVEMQNVGRTARAGKKGMAQLIIRDPKRFDMNDIKENRAAEEASATQKAIQDAYKTQLQDSLFSAFCSLEREYLPGVSEIWLARTWEDLKRAWHKHADEALSAVKIQEYVRQKTSSFQILANLKAKAKTLVGNEENKEPHQAQSERDDFEKEYRELVLKGFCEKHRHLPPELITCLRNEQEYEPNQKPKYSELAEEWDWGLNERKGLEECWGLWLKGKHFAAKDVSIDEALQCFEDEFASSVRERAQNDELVRNPHYYVLKGNDYLYRDDLEQAIACYDRAIKMDPDFSVNARYNKAQALLSCTQNKGDRQERAYEELKKAQEIIATISRPPLLTFSNLLAQVNIKTQTCEHVKHQLDVISQQTESIARACTVIEEAKSDGSNVKLTALSLSESLTDETRHSKVIREAAINGFTRLFTIEKVKPVPWLSIVSLALLSAAQITAGILITAFTASPLGIGLICEGVSDMITVISSAIHGSLNWAAWATQKGISLTISIVSFGLQGLKNAVKALVVTGKAITGSAVGLAKAGFKQVAKPLAVGLFKVGLKRAADALVSALSQGAVKECLSSASQHNDRKIFLEHIGKVIVEEVEKSMKQALLNNTLVAKALELDVQNGKNLWLQCFIEEATSLLTEESMRKCQEKLRSISSRAATDFPCFSHAQLLQVAEVSECLSELKKLTDKFIRDFNQKVQSYQSKIDAQQSRLDDISTARKEIVCSAPHIDLEETDIPVDSDGGATEYSSKSVSTQKCFSKPSNIEILQDCFTAQITSKLTDVMSASLEDPTISDKEVHAHLNNLTTQFRDQVRETSKRRHYSRSHRKRNKKDKKGKDAISSNEGPHGDINEIAKGEIERLKGDVTLGANDLALVACTIRSPIYVFIKNQADLLMWRVQSYRARPSRFSSLKKVTLSYGIL